MDIFGLTLSQMLMMFTLIAVGFLLRKCAPIPDNAGTVMAKLETYIFVPALNFFTLLTKCTKENFSKHASLILFGLLIVLGAILLSAPLSRLFVRGKNLSPEKAYQRNIYQYALTFGNFGFMGNFIILGVWGTDFFFQYSLFTMFISILCNSWGLYILIPKESNAGFLQNLKKGVFTPATISILCGMIFGLLNIKQFMPDFLVTAFDNASKCQGPVAMILAGFVIGGYQFKGLLTNSKVYLVTAMRLVAIPAALMGILMLLGANDELMTLALIAFATPLGLNTIVFPAAYGGETKTGASMAMISHALAVITIPLMYLLFIVVL